MLFEGFNKFFEFSIPFSAEAAYKGILQEFIDAEPQLAALLAGLFADLPTVIVKGYSAVGETLLADGVKIAADGFGPRGAAFTEGFFGGAEAEGAGAARGEGALGREDDVAVGVEVAVAGEDAVLAVDDGGDEVAFGVDGAYAFAVDDLAGLGAEVVPNFAEYGFEVVNLVHGDGGAGFAFDAALAAASYEVAAEEFGEYVGGKEDVAYLEDGEHFFKGRGKREKGKGKREDIRGG